MQPAERSGNVNEETSVELTQCGIQLKDGIIGYSKTYTIKPAMRLSDGKRVAVKLYNDTTLAAMFPAPVQAQGGRWPKTQRQKDFAAEYAREMNIVVRYQPNQTDKQTKPPDEPPPSRPVRFALLCFARLFRAVYLYSSVRHPHARLRGPSTQHPDG